jgi:hypothetical protein
MSWADQDQKDRERFARRYGRRPDALTEAERVRAHQLLQQDPTLTWGRALKLASEMPVARQAQ